MKMGLIAAKCTQCGAELTVDDTKEAGVCQYCGTAYITEKVINNYNTYVTNNEIHNYAGATINITSPNNPKYLCPKCQSSETRAVKLNTNPPKQEKFDSAIKWCYIFIAIFTLGTIGALVDKNISDTLIGILFTGGLYYLLKYYKNKQKMEVEIHNQKMYAWNHTFQCLRCGEQFLVNDLNKK